MSYFFSKFTFPHWPPSKVTRSCAPFLSLVIDCALFNWSFWKAVPLVFKISLVINSFSLPPGQISLNSSTFWVYCSRSSLAGSNVGTSVAMWFDVAVLPSVEAAAAVSSDFGILDVYKGPRELLVALRYQCDWINTGSHPSTCRSGCKMIFQQAASRWKSRLCWMESWRRSCHS